MRSTTTLLLGAALVMACGNRDAPGNSAAGSLGVARPGEAVRMASARPGDEQAPAATAAAPATGYWSAQKLIRTADMRIQVSEVPRALKLVDSVAKLNESLVADNHTTQDADGAKTAELVLRVPSEHFTTLVAALRALGGVKEEQLNTEDVTKEYADLETRLAVKEQTVNRLRTLLDTKTAKLADILQVEQALSNAVTELEQLKGQRQFYDRQIALSTVKVELYERTPSRLAQVSGPVGEAMHNSLKLLGDSAGAIVYIVIILLPWAIVALLVVWAVPSLRRRYLVRRGP